MGKMRQAGSLHAHLNRFIVLKPTDAPTVCSACLLPQRYTRTLASAEQGFAVVQYKKY